MAAWVGFHLHAAPEAWTERDHEEWSTVLASEGFARAGESWRGPPLPDGSAVTLQTEFDSGAGRFRLLVDADSARRHPVAAARAVAALAARLAERVEPVYGAGLVDAAPGVPRRLADVRALHALTVLGPTLAWEAGWERLASVPGFVVRSLPNGGALLHVPVERFTLEWTNDEEARFLEAEMFLGLALDPSRYRSLAGPAQSFAARHRAPKP